MFNPEAEHRFLFELKIARLTAATDAEVAKEQPTPQNLAFAAESKRLVVFLERLLAMMTDPAPPH